LGTNTFSVFRAAGTASPFFGLGLYFSFTATPFSGPFDAAPNLVGVDAPGAGSVFSYATSGAQVSTFGQFSTLATYSGATSFASGSFLVTITAFDYDAGTSFGALQLSVVAIPEPSVFACLGLGLVLMLGMTRLRDRTK